MSLIYFACLKTWTEAQDGLGAVNFITGVGGFLQALIFGYGGLRLNVESLDIQGDVPLPENSSYLYLNQIKYLNNSISLNYTQNNIHLSVVSANKKLPLVLQTRNRIFKLTSILFKILRKILIKIYFFK